MAHRDNHYEAAFEALLRSRHVPYVAVDESRRSLFAAEADDSTGSLKSLDFIVSPSTRPGSWLVDVKGRRFPAGTRRQFWKNWSTADDMRSLAQWEKLFGRQFNGLLVFAYWVVSDVSPVPSERLFSFRDRLYGFVAVRLDHYLSWARPISAKWETVAMPGRQFRALAEPIEHFFEPETHPAIPVAAPFRTAG